MHWVVVGQFGKAHGLKGLVKVHSFTDPKDNLLRYENWHMRSKDGWQKVELERVQLQDRAILAKIAGINDRDAAGLITNCQIAVAEEALPELNPKEHYWFHLIGLEVVNTQGVSFGKVDDLMATGSNDVLIVKGEKERLIPYLPEQVIVEVDRSNGVIRVDWDENF